MAHESKAGRSAELPDIVPHPRYGAAPRASGVAIPEAVIRGGFWSLSREKIFPETVLRADISKQNFSIGPREFYVDILRRCRDCERHFIFSAREQRYWFETLHFWVDADCVLCSECSRKSRTLKRRLRRYSAMFSKPLLTDLDLQVLVDDAIYLLEHGTLKNLNNVGAVKNRAMKIMPEYAGVARLELAIRLARDRAHPEVQT